MQSGLNRGSLVGENLEGEWSLVITVVTNNLFIRAFIIINNCLNKHCNNNNNNNNTTYHQHILSHAYLLKLFIKSICPLYYPYLPRCPLSEHHGGVRGRGQPPRGHHGPGWTGQVLGLQDEGSGGREETGSRSDEGDPAERKVS